MGYGRPTGAANLQFAAMLFRSYRNSALFGRGGNKQAAPDGAQVKAFAMAHSSDEEASEDLPTPITSEWTADLRVIASL